MDQGLRLDNGDDMGSARAAADFQSPLQATMSGQGEQQTTSDVELISITAWLPRVDPSALFSKHEQRYVPHRRNDLHMITRTPVLLG